MVVPLHAVWIVLHITWDCITSVPLAGAVPCRCFDSLQHCGLNCCTISWIVCPINQTGKHVYKFACSNLAFRFVLKWKESGVQVPYKWKLTAYLGLVVVVMQRRRICATFLQSNRATTKLMERAKNLVERGGEICPNTPGKSKKIARCIIHIIDSIVQRLEKGVMRNCAVFIGITNVPMVICILPGRKERIRWGGVEQMQSQNILYCTTGYTHWTDYWQIAAGLLEARSLVAGSRGALILSSD